MWNGAPHRRRAALRVDFAGGDAYSHACCSLSGPVLEDDAPLRVQTEVPVFLDSLVRLLLPRDNRFMVHLDTIAKNVAAGADCFAGLRDAAGPEEFSRVAEDLRRIEHEGDAMAHLLYDEIDKTFVTPIDREDLHNLTCSTSWRPARGGS